MRLLDIDTTSGGAKLVPSLAVRKGSPVWVKDGKYHPFRIEGTSFSARELFSLLSTRYETVHFMDLDGISDQDPDLDLLRDICSGKTSVVADIGVTYSDMVIDAIMAGASEAVVSTKTIRSLDEIASSCELTENLILELVMEGRELVSPDPEIGRMDIGSFMAEMNLLGIGKFIMIQTDPASESQSATFDLIRKTLPGEGELWMDVGSLQEFGSIARRADAAVISASRLIGGLG